MYEDIDFPKEQQKYCKDFCPEIFCSFLRASWPGDLVVNNIINKEAYRKPTGSLQEAQKRFQRSYENFQGRNPYNIFVTILEN